MTHARKSLVPLGTVTIPGEGLVVVSQARRSGTLSVYMEHVMGARVSLYCGDVATDELLTLLMQARGVQRRIVKVRGIPYTAIP